MLLYSPKSLFHRCILTCVVLKLKVIFPFPVLMGEDKTVVTRGCTALDNEDLYKCDMHTAGNQVKWCDLCVFYISPILHAHSRKSRQVVHFCDLFMFPPQQSPCVHLLHHVTDFHVLQLSWKWLQQRLGLGRRNKLP